MMRILKDEAGVEPTAMKIMAGVILLAIGLGIGVAVYKTVGGAVTAMKCEVSLQKSSATIGRPASGENTDNIRVDITLIMGTAETVTLEATGWPLGVTLTFSPPSGKPTFYSMMTVSVDNRVANTDLRKHTLTILAKDSAGRTSGSVPFDLTIQ